MPQFMGFGRLRPDYAEKKRLDPNSVVRESEFEAGQETARDRLKRRLYRKRKQLDPSSVVREGE